MAKIIIDSNAVYGFGNDVCGQLGINCKGPLATPTILGKEYCSIIASRHNYFASYIDIYNNLFVAGYNGNGNLGTGTTKHTSSPIQIPGKYIGAGASQTNSYFLKNDNTLWATGENGTQQLATGGTAKSSPVQIPGAWCCVVGGGGQYAAGILTNGNLRTWGINIQGNLGNNSIVTCSMVSSITGTWISLSAGAATMYGIKSDCTLWAWGGGANGGLGINCTNNKSTPVQIPGIWTNISAGINSDSYSVVVATKGDGTTWVWGSNANGALGINDALNRSSPTQLPGSWMCVALGQTSFGIKNDGSLFVWGSCINNSFINEHKSSPTQIPGNYCYSLESICNGLGIYYIKQNINKEFNKNDNNGTWTLNKVYQQKINDTWSDFIPTIDD